MSRCPTCRREVLPRPQNESFPFCNERCRFVDLGKWLGEEYRIADRIPEEDEDGRPALPGDGHSEETY